MTLIRKLVRETAKHFVLAGVESVYLADGFRDTSGHVNYLRSLSGSTKVHLAYFRLLYSLHLIVDCIRVFSSGCELCGMC